LKTGAKIAIGCAVAAFLAVVLVVTGLFGAAWWGKQKLDEATGGLERMADAQKEIGRYEEEANRNPFTAPADGVIEEARLLRFLAVRRDVFGVYEKYQDTLDRYSKREKPDFAAIGTGLQMFNELRLAQAKAQAREGLSDEEYRYLVQQVYKTAWAAGIAGESGGKQPSQLAREGLDKTRAELRKQLDNPGLSDEQRRQLEATLEQLDQQVGAAERAVESFDVPAANLELFRKHEAEIKKYAMNGLELLGL
jgi:hypothetical protein